MLGTAAICRPRLEHLKEETMLRTLTAGLGWTLAALLLAEAGHAGDSPASDMIRALEAPGPATSLGAEAEVFDRFVGTWDLEGEFTAADGTKTPLHGFWLFGWVLQGQVMQDLIIEGDLASGRQRGTSLRFFETKSRQWRVEWIPPRSGAVVILHGGAKGDRIELLGADVDGAKLRWTFNDIRPNSFLWRGETSSDGGTSWRVEQVMRLSRRAPAHAG
jgi:hypothetical protein